MMPPELFHTICLLWTALAVVTFVLLLFVNAPYGRHAGKGWGPTIANRWGWVLMEAPSFALIAYFLFTHRQSAYASTLSALWLLHYANRTFVFPLRIRTRGKRMPWIIVASAVFFNLVNAWLNGYFLSFLSDYSATDFYSWNFIAGILLFIAGAWINQRSDHLLIHLRRPGDTGYYIPRGFLFELVSCPNHLGEILQWGGFALMAINCPATSFLVWTMANLIPRAISHHRWYQAKFKDYPDGRKAIFPWLL